MKGAPDDQERAVGPGRKRGEPRAAKIWQPEDAGRAQSRRECWQPRAPSLTLAAGPQSACHAECGRTSESDAPIPFDGDARSRRRASIVCSRSRGTLTASPIALAVSRQVPSAGIRVIADMRSAQHGSVARRRHSSHEHGRAARGVRHRLSVERPCERHSEIAARTRRRGLRNDARRPRSESCPDRRRPARCGCSQSAEPAHLPSCPNIASATRARSTGLRGIRRIGALWSDRSSRTAAIRRDLSRG